MFVFCYCISSALFPGLPHILIFSLRMRRPWDLQYHLLRGANATSYSPLHLFIGSDWIDTACRSCGCALQPALLPTGAHSVGSWQPAPAVHPITLVLDYGHHPLGDFPSCYLLPGCGHYSKYQCKITEAKNLFIRWDVNYKFRNCCCQEKSYIWGSAKW